MTIDDIRDLYAFDRWATSPEYDEPDSNSYASVVCLACTRLQFIHKETGRLLGED